MTTPRAHARVPSPRRSAILPRAAAARVITVRVLLACLAWNFGGCGSTPSAAPQGAESSSAQRPDLPKSDLNRIDAVGGRAVVVVLDRGAPLPPHVRLDDGVELESRLLAASIELPPSADPWLPGSGEWTTSEPAPDTPPLLIFTLPQAARGQGVWINGARCDVQWLAPAESLVGELTWKPTLPHWASENAALMSRLRDLARSPLERWRVRLLLDGMRNDVPPTRMSDPVIEAWAQCIEARWRLAFARLSRENPDTCDRLKKRLSAVADFGSGRIVPAWPNDFAALDRLAKDLLDPRLPQGGVASRAEQFLAEQPQGVIWVIDDGGVLGGPNRRPLATIGVTNLSGRDQLVSGFVGEPSKTDLLPLGAGRTQILTLAAPASEGSTPAPAAVTMGRWRVQVPVASAPTPVQPPGLAIGPMLPDLSMRAWQYALSSPVGDPCPASALLYRAAADAQGARSWMILVECQSPSTLPPARDDRVCIHVGPPGMPGGVMCVDATGEVSGRVKWTQLEGPPRVVPISRLPDRWSFSIQVPDTAIEQGGILRLGLTREDGRGHRSAWPRPMLPWQEFPARAALDLNAWDGFSSSDR